MAKTQAVTPPILPSGPPAPPAPVEPKAGYTVVARRYRPQQFADLIGQEHVALALTNAITSGRIAHAFLFTGARGTGKTSTARILAKALNCVHGPTPTPCDVCAICTSIADGDDTDVLEIDGASNNKVEEIRDLKSNVGFRPQRARFKIYIIDEVHMLSNSAFNALLKTLEEPPAHVKFLFATTEAQKIPITILSRCQRFDFSAIGPAKVFETLKHIVKKEGLEADDDALHTIARRAAGSMRDAQTLLDQLLGFSDGVLTAEKLHALLGTAGDDRVAQLADAILTKDAQKALSLVSDAAEAGLQLGEMLDQLIDTWRGLMLVKVAGASVRDLPGTPSGHERLRQHAASVNLDTVLAGLDVLTTAKGKARTSNSVQLLVEVAVVRLSRMDELLSVSSLLQLATGGNVALPAGNARTVSNPATPQPARKAAGEGEKKNDGVSLAPPTSVVVVSVSGDFLPETLPQVWARAMLDVGMIRGIQLEPAGIPAIIGPNSLAIRFPAGYSSQYDAIRQETSQEAIRRTLKVVTGKDVLIRVEIDTTSAPTVRFAPQPPDRKKDLLQLPLFLKAATALGAQLIKVDDGFNPYLATPSPALVPLVADADADVPAPPIDPDEV